MMKQSLLALAAALPLVATEIPPMVESGPVHYDDVSYQPAYTPEAPAYTAGYAPATDYAPAADYSYDSGSANPIQPAASSTKNAEIFFNAYTSNYQVRGMGVTNFLSDLGCSSLSASYTLPNRNFFNRGIQQRISGSFGAIWGATEVLGDTPMASLSYAMGKELLPNLLLEVGYTVRHGGLEGYVARATGCAHRIAQDINITLSFNDHQRGLFGHALWGIGFQGLTGSYFDFELGYRFTDLASVGNLGTDVELSAGMSPSAGYWGGGVEGIDAFRLRAALCPFTHSGSMGRDGYFHLIPWVQCSWAGKNAGKIDRRLGNGPIDHFQITFGVDAGFRF